MKYNDLRKVEQDNLPNLEEKDRESVRRFEEDKVCTLLITK